jgi:hypothetical protein
MKWTSLITPVLGILLLSMPGAQAAQDSATSKNAQVRRHSPNYSQETAQASALRLEQFENSLWQLRNRHLVLFRSGRTLTESEYRNELSSIHEHANTMKVQLKQLRSPRHGLRESDRDKLELYLMRLQDKDSFFYWVYFDERKDTDAKYDPVGTRKNIDQFLHGHGNVLNGYDAEEIN